MVSSVNPFFSSAYASASIATLFAALPSGDAKTAPASSATGAASLQQSDLASFQKAAQASSAAIQAILQAAEGNAGAGQLSVSLAVSVYAENAGEQVAAPASGQPDTAPEPKANSNGSTPSPASAKSASSNSPVLRDKSANTLISVKQRYDRAPLQIEHFENLLKTAQNKLGNTSDTTSITALNERIASLKTSIDEEKSFVKQFPETLRRFDQSVRSTYSVSGNFLTKNEDGSYALGNFTVSNKLTGEFFYGHNGDGTIVEKDGIVQPFIIRELEKPPARSLEIGWNIPSGAGT